LYSFTCPACGSNLREDVTDCPFCGVNLSLYFSLWKRAKEWKQKAEELFQSAQYEKALEILHKTWQIQPFSPTAEEVLLEAQALARLHRFQEALSRIQGLGYTELEAQWKEQWRKEEAGRAHYDWAEHLYRHRLFHSAEEELRQALSLTDENPDVLISLASIYLERGDKKGGLELLLKGLRKGPARPRAIELLLSLVTRRDSSPSLP